MHAFVVVIVAMSSMYSLIIGRRSPQNPRKPRADLLLLNGSLYLMPDDI